AAANIRQYVAYEEGRPLIRIANPLSSEQDVMRPALLPGLLGALRTNLRNTPRAWLFEIGAVFWSAAPADSAARREAADAGRRLALLDAGELGGRGVCAFDLDLAVLLAAIPQRVRYSGISRYPAVAQDLALIVPDSVPAARVEALLRETGGKLLTGLTLFDVY